MHWIVLQYLHLIALAAWCTPMLLLSHFGPKFRYSFIFFLQKIWILVLEKQVASFWGMLLQDGIVAATYLIIYFSLCSSVALLLRVLSVFSMKAASHNLSKSSAAFDGDTRGMLPGTKYFTHNQLFSGRFTLLPVMAGAQSWHVLKFFTWLTAWAHMYKSPPQHPYPCSELKTILF